MRLIIVVYKFILHVLSAKHTRGFNVHSPFVYNFINNVICGQHKFYVFDKIENLRESLKTNKQTVYTVDYGTQKDGVRSVSSISKTSLKSPKYGQLFYRIIRNTESLNVLELGTSLGVTTSYLAAGSDSIKCISLEGSPEIAKIARQNIHSLDIKNVDIVVGNIDNTLQDVVEKFEKLDFVFFDANHRSKAVMNYFEIILDKIHQNTVLIVDDIYWSNDMERAWRDIKNHPKVASTIDLYSIGIVFFNTNLNKQHYKVLY
jgi:predicted O-methyltransferase YrrM